MKEENEKIEQGDVAPAIYFFLYHFREAFETNKKALLRWILFCVINFFQKIGWRRETTKH